MAMRSTAAAACNTLPVERMGYSDGVFDVGRDEFVCFVGVMAVCSGEQSGIARMEGGGKGGGGVFGGFSWGGF